MRSQKNFVGDDGHASRGADIIQLLDFVRLAEISRGIIRMHHDDPRGSRRDGLLQSVKINLPAVIEE